MLGSATVTASGTRPLTSSATHSSNWRRSPPRELVDLARQPKHGDAVDAVADHGLDLLAHGFAGEVARFVEKGIGHWVDAGKA